MKKSENLILSAHSEHTMKILLVEDEDFSRDVAVRILSLRGHSVTAATDGREALAIWEMDPARFDVLVTDISVPELGGIELTRAIREREHVVRHRLRIIAMTANASIVDAERCRAAGMDGCLPKPLRREDFLRTVEAAGWDDTPRPAFDSPGRPPSCDVSGLLSEFNHDLGFVAKLTGVFFDVFQNELTQLRDAVARRDADDVARLAHRLKGAVGNLRGQAMLAIAETIEKYALAGNLDMLPMLLLELESEFPRLHQTLQNVVRGKATAK